MTYQLLPDIYCDPNLFFYDSFYIPATPEQEFPDLPYDLEVIPNTPSPSGSSLLEPETDPDENLSLGDFVRKHREKLSLHQLDIMREANISNRKISLVEHHKRGLTQEEAERLAPVLRVSLQALTSKKRRSDATIPNLGPLKEILKQKKMKQMALARASRVDYRTISKVVNGRQELLSDQAERISKILETPIDQFVSKDAALLYKRINDRTKPPLCTRLKKLRQEEEPKLCAFAKQISIGVTSLAKIESGARPLTLKTVTKIASGLHLTLEEVCS